MRLALIRFPVAHVLSYKRTMQPKSENKKKYSEVHWDTRARYILGVQSPDDACDAAVRLRWVPAQVSASSLVRGSELRSPPPIALV